MGEIMGQTACDLLERLLCVYPKRRMTAQDALNHAFFQKKDLHGRLIPTTTKNPSAKRDALAQMWLRSRKRVKSALPHPCFVKRKAVIEWIFESGDSLNLCRETLHLAANSYDRLHSQIPGVTTSLTDQRHLGAVCLKMAEAYQEPSKEYYKQTNYVDYRERFKLEHPSETLVEWEKRAWMILQLTQPVETVWSFYAILVQTMGFNTKCGESLVELVLFEKAIYELRVPPHLLGLACYVSGVVLTEQAQDLEANANWIALRNRYPQFFWCSQKKAALHELVISYMSKAASPSVVRDLRIMSQASTGDASQSPRTVPQGRISRKSIDGHFPSAPWPIGKIVQLSSHQNASEMRLIRE